MEAQNTDTSVFIGLGSSRIGYQNLYHLYHIYRNNNIIYIHLKSSIFLKGDGLLLSGKTSTAGTKFIYGVSMYIEGFNRGMPHKKPVLSE
jgi:hypothetical protein